MSICIICGKEFIQKKKNGTSKTCSKSCAISLRNKTIGKLSDIELVCRVCGKTFITKEIKERVYCSRECYYLAQKGSKKPFTEEHKKAISLSRIGKSNPKKNGTVLNSRYWISKGFSEEEAIKKVSDIQKENHKKRMMKYKSQKFKDLYGDREEEMKKILSNNMKKYLSSLSSEEKEILRKKDSESIQNFWDSNSDRSLELKEKFSNNRNIYNKTIQRETILNFSEEKKQEIANKKRNTFFLRPKEEILRINKLRYEKSLQAMKEYKYFIYVKNGEGDIFVNSKYEKLFVEICNEMHILIDRGPCVNYEINGRFHNYYIDFFITKNQKTFLVELKCNHIFYKGELESGVLQKKLDAAQEYADKNNMEFLYLFQKNKKELKETLEKLC